MQIQKTLERARDLIKNPGNWTTNTLARDEFDDPVFPDDPKAMQFCALGALYKITGDPCVVDVKDNLTEKARGYLFQASCEMNWPGVGMLNDDGGHEKVLEMYDRAITELKNDRTGVVGGCSGSD